MNESAEQIMDALDYYFEDTHDLELRVKYNTLRGLMQVVVSCGYKNAGVVELIELAKAKALVERSKSNRHFSMAADVLLDIWKQER